MSLSNSEANFKKLSYKEIDDRMSPLPSQAVLELVSSKSIKIGDIAASLLLRREETKMVAEAVLQGSFRNRLSKLRAAYILCGVDRLNDIETDAIFNLIQDQNEEVASNALFGLVALRNREVIERLQKIESEAGTSEWLKGRVNVAIEAIERNDPKIYSPNYGG